MDHPFSALLKLQELDIQLDEARSRLKDIEAGIPLQRHERLLQQITSRLQSKEKLLLEQKRRAQRGEAEAAQCREERQRLEKRLYGGEISSVKEMEKMQARIAQLDKQADDHELDALEALEQVQQLTQEVEALTRQKQQQEAVIAERRQRMAEVEKKLRAKMNSLEKQRAEVVATITEPLLQQYNFHRSRGGVVLAAIQGDRCGSCRVTLPVALIARATRRESLEVCENCGRLLIWMGQ